MIDDFKPGCTGKKAFTSHGQAAHRAKRMRQDHEGSCFVEAYHCRFCGQFHIGQARDREARKAKGKQR